MKWNKRNIPKLKLMITFRKKIKIQIMIDFVYGMTWPYCVRAKISIFHRKKLHFFFFQSSPLLSLKLTLVDI